MQTESDNIDVYVKLVDGTECWVPAKAREVGDGCFEITECLSDDPEDTTALLQYLPGDVVRIEEGRAVSLVHSPVTRDRTYWRFLFNVLIEGGPTAVDEESPYLREVVSQVRDEIARGDTPHYPAIKNWMRDHAE